MGITLPRMTEADLTDFQSYWNRMLDILEKGLAGESLEPEVPSVGSLLEELRLGGERSIAEYGEDKASLLVQRIYDQHNAEVLGPLAGFYKVARNRQYVYGGTPVYDAMGNQVRLKDGMTVGMPLYMSSFPMGITRDWLEHHVVEDLADAVQHILTSDRSRLDSILRDILFTRENRMNYQDSIVDNMAFPCFAFCNGDRRWITGMGAYTDHDHYLSFPGENLTPEMIRATLTTVIEHQSISDMNIFVSEHTESALWMMTGHFYPFVPDSLTPRFIGSRRPGILSYQGRISRAIGRFDRADVWVVPWVPKGSLFVLGASTEGEVPLMLRGIDSSTKHHLALRYVNEHFPMRSSTSRRCIGFGIRNRHMGAALQWGVPKYSYTPEINLEYSLTDEEFPAVEETPTKRKK